MVVRYVERWVNGVLEVTMCAAHVGVRKYGHIRYVWKYGVAMIDRLVNMY